MTNQKEMRRASNPEQAVRFLSDRLRTTLALMHRGGDDLVPLILADLPRGSRLLLVSLGALEWGPANPSELALTSVGRELSATCAVTGLPRQAQNDLAALEQERARRAASGEDKRTVEGICTPPNGKL
jgi:hypothetical protein